MVKVGCFAAFVQPHVVYCNVCEAVDGIHFVRNLIRGLAYRDQISIMPGIAEKISDFLIAVISKYLFSDLAIPSKLIGSLSQRNECYSLLEE